MSHAYDIWANLGTAHLTLAHVSACGVGVGGVAQSSLDILLTWYFNQMHCHYSMKQYPPCGQVPDIATQPEDNI